MSSYFVLLSQMYMVFYLPDDLIVSCAVVMMVINLNPNETRDNDIVNRRVILT